MGHLFPQCDTKRGDGFCENPDETYQKLSLMKVFS